MFRSDRDALAETVDELRAENQRLRWENEAMRRDLLAHQASYRPFGAGGGLSVYKGGPIGDGQRAALQQHGLRAFPVWQAVLVHLLTFGVASWIRFNLLHDRLPKVEHDDPSAAKAISLHLIPYFNFYWVFFNALRLADRVNLQLRLRGEGAMIDRAGVIGAGVTSVVPYVNILFAPFVWLIVTVQMQRAINRVVAIDEAHRAASTGARFDAVSSAWPAREAAAPAGADDRAGAWPHAPAPLPPPHMFESAAFVEAQAAEEMSAVDAAPLGARRHPTR